MTALCAVMPEGVSSQASASELPSVGFVQPEPESEVGSATIENTTGHIDLVWGVERVEAAPAEASPAFELEGARSRDFAQPITFYSGIDTRTFLSGLAEGAYFFRIRTVDAELGSGAWSEVLAVDVDYVDRWKVTLLMLVGLICLVATIYIIVSGTQRTKGAC